MSFSLCVIGVDIEKVRKVIGSKDERLAAEVIKKNKKRFEEIDEEISGGDENIPFKNRPQDALAALQNDLARLQSGQSLDPGGALAWFMKEESEVDPEETCPSTSEVFEAWVFERALDPRFSSRHTAVFRALCLHFGRELPNRSWKGLRRGSRGVLFDAMHQAGVPHAESLFGRKLDLGEGRAIEIAETGYLTQKEVREVNETIANADLSNANEDVRPCLEEFREWLKICVNERWDLVTIVE